MSKRFIFVIIKLFSLVRCDNMEGYIVGGDFGNVVDHPHATYLLISCAMGGRKRQVWGCGGSILNQEIILSAAHCFEECRPIPPTMIKVTAGTEKNNERHRFTDAARFVTHPNYNEFNSDNDLALLKLSYPLRLGHLVKKVILLDYLPKQTHATVVGWGLVDEDQQIDSIRMKVAEQVIMTKHECLNVLKKFNYKTMICATNNKQKVGYPAEGDSGGALTIPGGIQVGLVSYKLPNIARNIVVYTDVARFYSWIVKTANSLYCTNF